MLSSKSPRSRQTRWTRLSHKSATQRDAVLQLRAEVAQTVCSSSWMEDCLYRGVVYLPDFQCSCALCREHFPHRRHPRQAIQSLISADCQAMHEDLDPDIAEELARLRNDRQRIGSVCLQSPARA